MLTTYHQATRRRSESQPISSLSIQTSQRGFEPTVVVKQEGAAASPYLQILVDTTNPSPRDEGATFIVVPKNQRLLITNGVVVEAGEYYSADHINLDPSKPLYYPGGDEWKAGVLATVIDTFDKITSTLFVVVGWKIKITTLLTPGTTTASIAPPPGVNYRGTARVGKMSPWTLKFLKTLRDKDDNIYTAAIGHAGGKISSNWATLLVNIQHAMASGGLPTPPDYVTVFSMGNKVNWTCDGINFVPGAENPYFTGTVETATHPTSESLVWLVIPSTYTLPG